MRRNTYPLHEAGGALEDNSKLEEEHRRRLEDDSIDPYSALLERVKDLNLIAEYLHLKRMKIIKRYIARVPDVDLGAGKNPKARVSLDINREFRPDIVADVQYLPLKSGVAGSLICSHVVEHVANLKQVLGEIRRVLRRDGRVAFFLPDSQSALWRLIRPYWSRYYEMAVDKKSLPETHLHFFNYRGFKSLMAEFFKPVKVGKMNFGMEIYAICERR